VIEDEPEHDPMLEPGFHRAQNEGEAAGRLRHRGDDVIAVACEA